MLGEGPEEVLACPGLGVRGWLGLGERPEALGARVRLRGGGESDVNTYSAVESSTGRGSCSEFPEGVRGNGDQSPEAVSGVDTFR